MPTPDQRPTIQSNLRQRALSIAGGVAGASTLAVLAAAAVIPMAGMALPPTIAWLSSIGAGAYRGCSHHRRHGRLGQDPTRRRVSCGQPTPSKACYNSAMTTITIDIPELLERDILELQDRLPEVLALGIREVRMQQVTPADEATIIAVLASQPTPEQVLGLRPSDDLQARASALIAQSKAGTLAAPELLELERYLMLEHLVRMAKAHALKRLATPAA